MRKKVNIIPQFVIINNKDQFFIGLKAGNPLWSDNADEAKIFNNDDKMYFFEQNRILWGKTEKLYI